MPKPKLLPTSQEVALYKDIFSILDSLAPIYLPLRSKPMDRKSDGPDQESTKRKPYSPLEQSFQNHGRHESGIPRYTCDLV